MRGKRFKEEQIINILKEAESGVKTQDLCRTHGISSATLYNWKAKYSGLTVSEVRRLKNLEQENRKLKEIIADLTLDNKVLREVNRKNF